VRDRRVVSGRRRIRWDYADLATKYAIAVVACLPLAACGGSGSRAGNQTPLTGATTSATRKPAAGQPTPLSSAVRSTPADIGPFSQETAFADSTRIQSYVLDIASGQVYVIGSVYGSLRWLDDRTLYTDLASRVVLDTDAPPHAGPIPTAEPRAGSSAVSADGLWRMVVDADGRAWVESVTGAGRLNLPAEFGGGQHAWSPGGHLLAIAGGGACNNETLLLADPDSGSVRPLTLASDVVKNFLWRPDGSAVAASLVTSAGSRGRYEALSLGLDGSRMLLVPEPQIRLPDELALRAWNPSGTRLLFALNFARKC
jgi:hypothetical protein